MMGLYHQTGNNAGLFQQEWNNYEYCYFTLLYKIYCFIGILPFWTPTKLILHARLFINMIIPHAKIIAFQTIMIIHCLWIFYIAKKYCGLYNKQKNT